MSGGITTTLESEVSISMKLWMFIIGLSENDPRLIKHGIHRVPILEPKGWLGDVLLNKVNTGFFELRVDQRLTDPFKLLQTHHFGKKGSRKKKMRAKELEMNQVALPPLYAHSQLIDW